MIPVEFSLAVALYLSLTVVSIFFVWLIFEFRKKLKVTHYGQDVLWQCTVCTYVYLGNQYQELSVCPRCGSYNQREE